MKQCLSYSIHTVLTPQLIYFGKEPTSEFEINHKYKKKDNVNAHGFINRFLLILQSGKHINILHRPMILVKITIPTVSALYIVYSLQYHATHSFCNIVNHILRILSVFHAIICI